MGLGTKTISVFLSPNGKTSWLTLPSLLSLLPGCTVQPENTYFFHSLQRGKYHSLSPINKPTLPLLYVSLPSLNAKDKKTVDMISSIFLSLFTISQYIIVETKQKRWVSCSMDETCHIRSY